MHRLLSMIAVLALPTSCVGTTGGEVIIFHAAAAGPADAIAGEPYPFVSGRGWNVTLTRAKMHIGALYLSRSMPVSGAGVTSCVLPATYVGEVTDGTDVDLLSPAPQPFPAPGKGATSPRAIAAQIWLTHVRVDEAEDTDPVLDVEGTAEKNGDVKPFKGTLTIGKNRTPGTDSTQAGSASICKQRIVSPIPVSIVLGDTGYLFIRIDPKQLFHNVDFATLPPAVAGFAFSDEGNPKDQASRNLYLALHENIYSFEWVP